MELQGEKEGGNCGLFHMQDFGNNKQKEMNPLKLEIEGQVRKIDRIIDEISELKSEEDFDVSNCNQLISIYKNTRLELILFTDTLTLFD